MNEKRKQTPRRLTFILLPLILIALLALLSLLYLRRNEAELDIFFLHQEENQTMQVYGLNLDIEKLEDARPIQITIPENEYVVVSSFAVHGDWLLYAEGDSDSEAPEASRLMLMNWRSGEKNLLLDCIEAHISCNRSQLHFSPDGQTIFIHTEFPYPETVWMLDKNGSEPAIFAQDEGVSDVRWLSENFFVYSFRDFDHNNQEILYNIDSQTSQDLRQLNNIYEGSFVQITPDNRYLVLYNRGPIASDEPLYVLLGLEDSSTKIYTVPSDVDGMAPYWHPNQPAFLYRTGNFDDIGFYDLETQEHQVIWSGEIPIHEIHWRPDGAKVLFGLDSFENGYKRGELELWLYDMEAQEALPLPVIGYSLQWLK